MLRILSLYKKNKLIFPLTWLLGFGISGLSWFVTRQISQTVGTQFTAKIEYSIKGWPYYWGITTFDGGWKYRFNSFFINGVIWWLIASIFFEIYLRLKKK